MKPPKVPIVAYHSVADEHRHPFRHLSLPVAAFERQLQHLERRGFETVTLHDVHAYLKSSTPPPPKSVVLTFDDGFLDNWVHAFPLLKKYGMKATIFVMTDFIDPSTAARPTLEDVWACRIDREELEWWGYCSWPEIEAMHASGLIDIQSHTKSHTWSYVSPTIVDFHRPGDDYFWLFWNRYPERKHRWLTTEWPEMVPWGTPVYEFRQNLVGKRYFEDPRLAEILTGHVGDNGGKDFFSRSRWREELQQQVERYRGNGGDRGHYESESDYRDRVFEELRGSKRILGERLGKQVDFLCWPCGQYNDELQRLALESGYRATVAVKRTSNQLGDDPAELRRIVFGQDYRGPFQSSLVHLHFCGNVNYHAGFSWAFPFAPAARRLMMLGNLVQRVSGS
jgi:Polysaccharide deacetylase